MRPVALSDEIAVGEIPSADEIAILARAGFRSLINVQPEGEVERLLSAADVAAGAEAAGMKYAHVPVASRRVPNDKVEAFAQAMISLPRPIYACCYSGARAAAAWALAVSSAMPPADIVANCSTAGFDMSALLPELEQRHRGTVAPAAVSMPTAVTPAAIATTPPPVAVAPAAIAPVHTAAKVTPAQIAPAAAPANAQATIAPVTSPPPTPAVAPKSAPAAAPAPAQTGAPAAAQAPAPTAAPKSASAALDAADKIIFPRAAGSGGFSTAG